MATSIINSEFEQSADMYKEFINDTRGGKYTEMKPDITQISYQRLDIQEQSTEYAFGETSNDVLLFGIAF